MTQRTITINSKAKKTSQVYSDLLLKKPEWQTSDMRLSLLHGILPAYDAMDKTADSIDDLAVEVGKILKNYHYIFWLSDYTDLKHYLYNQKVSQQNVKDDKSLYKGLVTTVGFEHEFADMKNSPLSGVSHMEIAESKTGLPYTGIKFLVETDAHDALELVSPPLLIPTVKGSTIPSSDAVSTADNLFKWALVTTLTVQKTSFLPDVYMNRKYVTQTLSDLMKKLTSVTGFTFELHKNLEIKPEYLSHRADLDKLKAHVSPTIDSKLKLKQKSLEDIVVGESEKSVSGTYRIASQVNFATDMEVAGRLNAQEGLESPHTEVFRVIEGALKKRIPLLSGGSSGLKGFYPIMIGKLAGLFSVYSQNYVRKTQQLLHGDLLAKATPSVQDRNRGLPNKKAVAEFKMHTSLMSFVKDVTPGWIKDHLLSIAKGMLKSGDYPKLLASLKKADFSGFNLPGDLSDLFKQSSHSNLAGHWAHFKEELSGAVDKLKSKVEHIIIPLGSSVFMDTKADVGLYGHDADYVGARQDTYQDPEKIQMPEIHDKRLHVVEIRRGEPSAKLAELERGL